MAPPRDRHTTRLRAQQRRAQSRTRRAALVSVTGALVLVALVLIAFDDGTAPRPPATTPIEALEPSPEEAAILSGRPEPEVLATVGNLPVQLPVASGEVTEVGFHGSDDGAFALEPVGRQGNAGLLARLWWRIAGGQSAPAWYQLPGPPGTEALDVGARAGVDVYSPVDGAVVAISERVIDGIVIGARIDIRPTRAPAAMLSIQNVEPDPSLAVGTPVYAATSRLGTVANVARVEDQALAAVTREAGNNVAISIYPATGSLP
ncbi:MAG: hypothetical protein EXQ77_03640 [Thermoleophilia bacterium]|nr:hypothetical protein [Thermoleophilia bacterium]